MKIIVPYKKKGGKSRLSPLLSLSEREELAEYMLEDVVATLSKAGLEDVYIVSDEGLNAVLNKIISNSTDPMLIIMPDLPLISIENVLDVTSSNEDVVISPGRGGGTNILFLRDPSTFRVDYHGASFLNHLQIAKDMGLLTRVYESFYASCDIDEVDDLAELIIHGRGKSSQYLNSIGISLQITSGRVHVKREGSKDLIRP
ncbi:MAG: 2-phospho-L-lactate guanylyltransferase [Methanocellales archaeon]|nr:2-phospho-L-lactate guanylyltransferase [Methanocellales archaeon]